MKQVMLLVLLAVMILWTAGCRQSRWTEYDLGYCRLKVRGSFKRIPVGQAALDAERDGLPVHMTLDGGTGAPGLQIMIEVRFVTVNDQSLRVVGVDLWFGDESLLAPSDLKVSASMRRAIGRCSGTRRWRFS